MSIGRRTVLIGLGVAIAVLAVAAALLRRGTPAPSPTATTPDTVLPDFVLQREQGDSVGRDDLLRTVWVANFICTRCGDESGTQRMAALAKEISTTPSLTGVKLVSFTTEPDVDSAAVLRDYARRNGADPATWMFLTGTRRSIDAVAHDAFRTSVPTRAFFVVDKRGRVRGSFDAATDDGQKTFHSLLGTVLTEPAPTDVFVPPDVARPGWLEARRMEQLATAGAIEVPHDFQFIDAIGASGITFRHVNSLDVGKFYKANHYDHGTGVAAADIDNDGLTDVYFVNQVGQNRLFRNVGGGRFEDVTSQAGVAVGDRASVGAAFADVDNDGDADLFVTAVRAGNLLFLNDGHGVFADASEKAGVRGPGTHSSGPVFFDYDGDGLLDLFVANVGQYTRTDREQYPDGTWRAFGDAFAGHLHPERSEQSILYHNAGGGRFEDVTTTSGLAHAAWSGEATAFDYDGDGRSDLYVASMQGHDELWVNRGGGRFERRSREIFPATPWGAMGVKALDWNGDGRLDLYVTDMHTDMSGELLPQDERKKHRPADMFPPRFLATDGRHVLGNALFTNRGGSRFDEMSDAANAETGWPWGPSAGDLNADGWPDLFIAAGMNFPFRYRGNDVLLNDRGRRFAPAEFILGVEPRKRLAMPWFELDCDAVDAMHDFCRGEIIPVMTDDTRSPQDRGAGPARRGRVTIWAARASRSAAIFDVDDDGDLDILTNNYGDQPQLFVSDLAQRAGARFLSVQLVGATSNRQGLGAVVTVEAAGRRQVQVNDGKSGYLAQSALPLYFGLGPATSADSITVKWPSGHVQVVRTGLASGSKIIVRETS